MKKFILFNLPLFLIGWWGYIIIFEKKPDITDAWVTVIGLLLIWVFANVEDKK